MGGRLNNQCRISVTAFIRKPSGIYNETIYFSNDGCLGKAIDAFENL
jgi:hypothetical protein